MGRGQVQGSSRILEVAALSLWSGPGGIRQRRFGGRAAHLQQDPGSVGSGRLPATTAGLFALRQLNGGRSVGFPELAVIDVPEILAGAEVGAEGLDPVASVDGIPLGAAPVDVGAGAVVPPVQVVEDHDVVPAVLVEVGHRQGPRGLGGKVAATGFAVASLRRAPVDEGGDATREIGVVVAGDDVQEAVPVEVGHRMLQGVVALQAQHTVLGIALPASPHDRDVPGRPAELLGVPAAAHDHVQPAVGIQVGDFHRGGGLDPERGMPAPAEGSLVRSPENLHPRTVHVAEDQVQETVLVQVGDGRALADQGFELQLASP